MTSIGPHLIDMAFRQLIEKLSDRLRHANEILAHLNQKNIIDDDSIMENWELLAETTNVISEPNSSLIEDALNDIKLAKEVESLPNFDLIIQALESVEPQDVRTQMRINFIPRLQSFCDFLWDSDSSMRPAAKTLQKLVNDITKSVA